MITGLATTLLAAVVSTTAYVPTSDYREETIEGFTILISPEATQHPIVMVKLREELTTQLRMVAEVLPEAALPAVRKTRVWVEWRRKKGTAAEFHSSKVWLSANRYNPEKFGGVEINNVDNFLSWSKGTEGLILLHELSHAYLFSLSDYEQLLVHLAYLDAKDSGSYDAVRYQDGQVRRAYAMTDTQEYFAELTEAYFYRNDFFPFRRPELKSHDPSGFEAVVRAWEAGGALGSR